MNGLETASSQVGKNSHKLTMKDILVENGDEYVKNIGWLHFTYIPKTTKKFEEYLRGIVEKNQVTYLILTGDNYRTEDIEYLQVITKVKKSETILVPGPSNVRFDSEIRKKIIEALYRNNILDHELIQHLANCIIPYTSDLSEVYSFPKPSDHHIHRLHHKRDLAFLFLNAIALCKDNQFSEGQLIGLSDLSSVLDEYHAKIAALKTPIIAVGHMSTSMFTINELRTLREVFSDYSIKVYLSSGSVPSSCANKENDFWEFSPAADESFLQGYIDERVGTGYVVGHYKTRMGNWSIDHQFSDDFSKGPLQNGKIFFMQAEEKRNCDENYFVAIREFIQCEKRVLWWEVQIDYIGLHAMLLALRVIPDFEDWSFTIVNEHTIEKQLTFKNYNKNSFFVFFEPTDVSDESYATSIVAWLNIYIKRMINNETKVRLLFIKTNDNSGYPKWHEKVGSLIAGSSYNHSLPHLSEEQSIDTGLFVNSIFLSEALYLSKDRHNMIVQSIIERFGEQSTLNADELLEIQIRTLLLVLKFMIDPEMQRIEQAVYELIEKTAYNSSNSNENRTSIHDNTDDELPRDNQW